MLSKPSLKFFLFVTAGFLFVTATHNVYPPANPQPLKSLSQLRADPTYFKRMAQKPHPGPNDDDQGEDDNQ